MTAPTCLCGDALLTGDYLCARCRDYRTASTHKLTSDELIAALQKHVDNGLHYTAIFAREPLDYKALWMGMCETIHAASNKDFDNAYVTLFRERMHALIATAPPSRETFQLNTTQYGREQEYDCD